MTVYSREKNINAVTHVYGIEIIPKQDNGMKFKNQSGFTVVELMIVGSILIVLLAIGAPGLQTFIKNNRMLAQTNVFMVSVKTARSEAMTQRVPVRFCSSDSGTGCSGTWSDGHIAFTDNDGNGNINGDDIVVLFNRTDSPDVTISYSNGGAVVFDRRGRAVGSSGNLLFCDDRGSDYARGITIDPIGRSKITTGTLDCGD